MSVSAFITWTIQREDDEISWVEIIRFLLKNGWNLNDNGGMTYLPLHDNGMYDWQSEKINEEKLFRILTKKERLKEELGVCITWQDSQIGGSLLIFNDCKLLLSITINRQTAQICEGMVITDVNWYLTRMSSILSKKEGIVILATEFVEHI